MSFSDEWLSKHCLRWKSSFAFRFTLLAFCAGVSTILPNSALAQQQCSSTPISVGYRDFSYAGGPVTSEPTAEKPQSKLWFNDGSWWGVLWDSANEVYTIHRYDFGNQCWIKTGPNVDERGRSAQDALWDEANNKLYVGSQARVTIQDGQPLEARLYRYSYNSSTESYSLDAGFPATIDASAITRALTIAKDSNGKLWATWTENFKVMVNRTDGNDTNWGTPFILPAQQFDLGVDLLGNTLDVSAIVAFDGDKIGILWGNQNDDVSLTDDDKKYFFSVHADSTPDTNWLTREDVLPGLSTNNPNRTIADDHINLAVDGGVVMAVLKTGLTADGLPTILVTKRQTNGTWTFGTAGTTNDGHTRPIMLYDSAVDSVFVFAKADNAFLEDVIYMKSAHVNDLTFAPGLGRRFLRSHTESDINNPTSTKQTVNATTGILVLASDKSEDVYLHNYMAVGNIRPIAVDDNADVNEGSPTSIDVLANDSDPDGTLDVTSVSIGNVPLHGTAVPNATTGEIIYTSNPGYFGTDIFSYTVNDNRHEGSQPGTVVVTVNASPIALDDSVNAPKQTVVAIDVLANDSDANGTIDPTTVVVVEGAKFGLFSVNGSTGAITYSPNPGFFGVDSLKYTVNDNEGAASNVAKVRISVGVPIAEDDSGTTNEDIPLNIDVLANDTDLDGTLDPATVTVMSMPGNGAAAVVLNGEANFRFPPTDDAYIRTDQPTRNYGVLNKEELWVRTHEGGSTQHSYLKFSVTGIFGTIISAKIRLYVVDGSPDGGSVYPVGNSFEGTGTPWSDSLLTFLNAPQLPATPLGSFGPVDEAEIVEVDVTAALSGNGVYSFAIRNGTTNRAIYGTKESANPPELSITLLDSGAPGSITYVPNLDFAGTDSYTYTVKDDDGVSSNEATVTVTVVAGNDPPIVIDDVASTNEETAVVIDVLANDDDPDGTIINSSVTIIAQPTNGSATVDGLSGAITYTPALNFEGADSLTYTVADDEAAVSDTAKVTITVIGVNDAPQALNDASTTGEDTPVAILVLSNDSDVDGTIDSTTVTVVSSASNGTATVDPVIGTITYTPNTNFFGMDSLSYTVADNQGAVSGVAKVTIGVSDTNDPPTALDDSTTVAEDNPAVVDVLSNDSDLDGNLVSSSVTVVTAASNGTTSVNASTGEITYTPSSNFFGVDTFTYTVADDFAAVSNAATVKITVTSENDAPTATDDTAITDEDASVGINVLDNDVDPDGTIDPTSVTVVSNASNGTTSVNGTTGEITYSPAANFFGSDSFTYTVADDQGAVSGSATVTVTVSDVNDLPVAADDQATTPEDTPVTIAILSNDNDDDGTLNVADVTIVTPPGQGAISVDNDLNALVYTPNENFEGVDTFTYTASDDDGGTSNEATVTVSVSDVNDEPVATDDQAATPEDTPVTIDVLSNDTDVDGTLNVADVTVVASPGQGTISVDNGLGVLVYTPNANFEGVDTFTYTASDDDGGVSNEATVTVTVSDINDLPVAVDDQVTTPEDTPVTIEILSNDTDVDGTLNVSDVTIVASPANGAISVDTGLNALVYTPNTNFEGVDTFTYTASDDDGGVSNAATVTITVSSVNDAPVAADDAVTTTEDVAIPAIDVLSNDADVDGSIDVATVSLQSLPSQGTATVDAVTGTIAYTPRANFFGTDTFTYTVQDNLGLTSNPATITVTVEDENDPPVAVNDAETTNEDVPVEIDVLANDIDIDGSLVLGSVSVAAAPSSGTAAVDANTGRITYTPNLNFGGTDTFTYTVEDDDGGVSNAASVTVIVTSVNDAPVAADDAVTTTEDVAVNAIDVLANDVDVDGSIDVTTVALLTPPSQGFATVDGVTGTITYTPRANVFGTDSFTYMVRDDVGLISNPATVTVTIADENDPPVAVSDAGTTNEDIPVEIDVLSNDIDVDGSLIPGSVSVQDEPSSGTTSVDANTGRITYTPNLNFGGTDIFTYKVDDDDGATSNAVTVTITVLSLNDRPIAVNDTVLTNRETFIDINVTANDLDVDGTINPLTVAVTAASNGTIAVLGGGVLRYSPNSAFVGTDQFTYSVRDNEGLASNDATVMIEVNDLPLAVADEAFVQEGNDVEIDVLANDSDPDGVVVPSTVVVVSSPPNGTTSVEPTTGRITYSPAAGFSGRDSFTYTFSDEDGGVSNAATVTVTVNDLPVAVADSVLTNANTPVTIDVTLNDTDSDGSIDPTTVAVATQPSNGSISVDPASGAITYTPNTQFFGVDTFTYRFSDEDGGVSNDAIVRVRVNAFPMAANDLVSTAEDEARDIIVLQNDADPDGSVDSRTVLIVQDVVNGNTSVDATTGVVRYTPNPNFFGSDTFTYTVADNDGAVSGPGTVTITILDVNDLPRAVNDVIATDEDVAVEVDVLANDSDSDGTLDVSTVAIIAPASNGTTSVNPSSGRITYTPNLNFEGTDLLTYTVRDDDGGVSNEATVTVSVSGENDAPVATDDVVTTTEDVTLDIAVLDNDRDVDGSLEAGTVTLVSPPSNGTATVDATTGVITYSPSQDFFGTDSFTYTVRDNLGLTSNAALVTITVAAENDLPVAVGDEATTDEDFSVEIAVLANDSDLDGTLVLSSVRIASGPTSGATSLDENTGRLTYTPNPDFEGTDSFTYTVDDDGGGTSNEATVTISVRGINDPPVAVNDTLTADRGVAVEINVTLNDRDVDGTVNPVTVAVTAAGNGTISVLGGGIVRYAPNSDFVGTDEFTYTVRDNQGAFSNDATVRVKVNDVPVAVADDAFVQEGSEVVIDILLNDSDSDGTLVPSSVTIVSGPQSGSTSLEPTTGAITYRPNEDFAGRDAFTYTVSDENGGTSNAATVTVTVNDLPVAVADTVLTMANTLVSISITENDHDSDGSIESSTVVLVSNPSNGSISFDPDRGIVVYAPNAGFFGVDEFRYTVQDDAGGTSNEALVTIDVNAAPVAVDDAVAATEDVTEHIDVLRNDSDADGNLDSTTVLIVRNVLNGRTVVNEVTGVVSYTPDPEFFGTETFRYTVKDNDGALSNEATVTINVGSENDLPQAISDVAVTEEETAVVIDVLSNDRDLDGTLDLTSVTIVAPAANGTTTVDGVTGAVTYVPNLDFVGTDTFTYTVLDSDGGTSNEATVSVTVTGENDPPVAFDDQATTSEEAPVTIDVLSNDTDVDGLLVATTVTLVRLPENGSASVNATSGTITYTPSTDFVGTDSLTYTVQDDNGLTSNAATVTITITDENDAPVARNDEAATQEEVAVDIPVVLNDDDIDGTVDPTSVSLETAPANGTATIDRTTGVITYSPSVNFFGTDSFTYTIRDDIGLQSNAATVTVTVTDVNEVPVALNDVVSTIEETPVEIRVLDNDSDVDGTLDASTLTIETPTSEGSTSINPATGVITYTPNPNFGGTDSFSYRVSDNVGAFSNVATVAINVGSENDAPVARNDEVTTDEDVAVEILILSNDDDVDGSLDASSLNVPRQPFNGAISIDLTTGVVTYTPDAEFSGTDTFTYIVRDNFGLESNVATVTVTVQRVIDPPVAKADVASTNEGRSVEIDVLSNDVGVDGVINPSTVSVIAQPLNGAVSVNPSTGVVTYNPSAGFSGTDTFGYTVADGSGARSNVAIVTVLVSDSIFPSDDTFVRSNNSTNYGAGDIMRARTSDKQAQHIGYLKFNVTDLSGSLERATLRLSVVDGSAQGGSIFLVSNSFAGGGAPWTEGQLLFNNRPAVNGAPIAVLGSVSAGERIEIDVTSVITGNGIYSFAITSAFDDAVEYSTKEAGNPAELILETSGSSSAGPVILSFDPASGVVGSVVTILGTNFGSTRFVAFNGVPASSFEVISNSELRVDVPTGATNGKIAVTNNEGTSLSINDFTIIAPPVLSSFSPSSGPVGTQVTVTGSRFTGLLGISFDGVTASTFTLDNDSRLRVTVPPGASTGLIRVENGAGSATSAGTFTVTLPPTVSSFTPTTGPFGTTVTVTGTNFVSLTGVSFNGVSASFEVDSESQLRATVPAGASTGAVSVTNGAGAATSSSSFQVLAPPAVTSFSPTGGLVGTEVTISGGNFGTATGVTFNGLPAGVFSVDSPVQIRATVPDGASTGPIAVTNNIGTGISTTPFSVRALPTVTSFAPLTGSPGTEVTITGSNFRDATRVEFGSVPTQDFLVDSDNRIRATVPSGALSGTVRVHNVAGSGESLANFIVAAGPSTLTFDATDDTYVRSNRRGNNYGQGTVLRLRKTDSNVQESYIKFNLTGLASAVDRAVLRLVVANGGSQGGSIFVVSADWNENSITFDNAPGIDGSPITTLGAVSAGETVEFDVRSAITGNGTIAFGLKNSSGDAVEYASSEVGNGPQLIVDLTGGPSSNAPLISAFSPTGGVAGTQVTITGNNFLGTTDVFFNNISASSFDVDSNTRIRAVVGPGSTTGKVGVSSLEGTGFSPTDFVMVGPPVISSFSPTTGSVGTEVTLFGSNFSGALGVRFNGVFTGTFTVVSDTQLRATVPSGATTGSLGVENTAGSSTSSGNFTVTLPPAVTSFTPASGTSGTVVTVTGSNFNSLTAVLFNGVAASNFNADSPTQLRATVPALGSTGPITVTNAAGTGVSTASLEVLGPPVVTSFVPAGGLSGTEVTITGGNFNNVTGVAFNGVPAAGFTATSSNQIRATVPGGASTGAISVTNNIGTASSSTNFVVAALPAVTAVSPQSGSPGTEVTISGSNFSNTLGVDFGSTPAAEFRVDSNTRIRATVPAGAASGIIRVRNIAGAGASNTIFIVTSGPATLSFGPTDDSFVRENRPGDTSGGGDVLRVRESLSRVHQISYLKFNVTGITSDVESATLRLSVSDGGGEAGSIFPVSNDWQEETVNWNNAPEISGSALMSLGGVSAGQVVEFTVTSAIRGDGVFSFAIRNGSDDAVEFFSKEGGNPPELLIRQSGGPSPNAPAIAAFAPAGGAIGSEVTITGINFQQATNVFFNNISASSFVVDSSTRIRAVVGAGTTTGKVGVSSPDGTALSATDFVIVSPPTITLFSPASGPIGTGVTLIGNNFTGATSVSVNSTAASSFVVENGSRITFSVPAGASSGPIAVTNAAGTSVSSGNFAVVQAPPVITAFSPGHGIAGTEVTISGGSFSNVSQVAFSGSPAEFSVVSETEIRATAPTGVTTGPLSVVDDIGTGVSSTNFAVVQAPSVASFSPIEGPVGTELTITGANLQHIDQVAFNGTPASGLSVDSNSKFRTNVPAGASTGFITVSNLAGSASSASPFSVIELPSTLTLNPTDDVYVHEGKPDRNHSHDTNVRVRSTETVKLIAYFKFNVTGLSGSPESATLRLFVEDGSDDGGSIFQVSNNFQGTTTPWDEDNLVFNNAPAVPNNAISSVGQASQTVEFDLTSAITGSGTYSFAIANRSEDLLIYSANGSANPPQLTIETGAGVSNVPSIASFTPIAGGAGTQVTITGLNLGGINNVQFNGAAASNFFVDSPTQIRATAPTGVTTGPIRVSSIAGTAASLNHFQVPTGETTFSFSPTDDAMTRSDRPDQKYGLGDILRARRATSNAEHRGYMKFNVTGLNGVVTGAKIRLFVLENSSNGGSIFSVSNDFLGTGTPWSEEDLTSSNAPDPAGTAFSTLGAISAGETVEFDVTGGITGNGVVSFVLASNSNDAAIFHSKENANPPELIVETDGGASLPKPPSIASFTPTAGPVGTEVTVSGNNLNGTTAVRFNGVAASSLDLDSNAQLRATVPPGATTGSISVTNADGTTSSANSFSVLGPPTISSFAPTSGPVGQEVTIGGSNFSGLTDISFNGTSASNINLDSDTQVRATVPLGASTGPITVSNAMGSSTTEANFTLTNLPSVLSFTPATGTVGTVVTITGINFTDASRVTFNGTAAATFSVDSDTQIQATVPDGASTGKIGVTNPDGSGESATSFAFPAQPTISFFSPASGVRGSEVTIFGTNFLGVTSIVFNGAPATEFSIVSESEIRANAPGGATSGPISVTNSIGTAVSSTSFTVSTGIGTFSFFPSDDAYVRSSRDTMSFGTDADLKVRISSTAERNVYLKFKLSSLAGTIESAKIKLECTDGSLAGGSIYSVSNNFIGTGIPWSEEELAWVNAPAISGIPLTTLGTVGTGQIVEFDVTAAIVGDGTYSFAIRNGNSDLVNYSSKEGSTPPELVVTTGAGLSKQSPDTDDKTDDNPELNEVPLPDNPTLYANYPNPFNIETTIEYALPKDAKVQLRVYNLRGQVVRVLVDGFQKAGMKRVSWDGRNSDKKVVATGVYLVRFEVGELKQSRKITLQK